MGGCRVNISGSLFRKVIHNSLLRCNLASSEKNKNRTTTHFKRNKLPPPKKKTQGGLPVAHLESVFL